MRKFNPYRGNGGKFTPRNGAAEWNTNHYRALDRALASNDKGTLTALRTHAMKVPGMRKPGGRGKQNVVVQIDRALKKAVSMGSMSSGAMRSMSMGGPTNMPKKRRMKSF